MAARRATWSVIILYFFGSNLSDAEFMQKRWPVGAGPSGKTCPKCASQRAQMASVRVIPKLRSLSVATLSANSGCEKLGHPVPESNFASELKSGVPQHTHRYVPAAWLSQYSPVKARSVPFL